VEDLAKIAYEAYRASTGGVSAVSGAPLPEWEDQAQPIRDAWDAAAQAVARALLDD
jgi:hypothetical protein